MGMTAKKPPACFNTTSYAVCKKKKKNGSKHLIKYFVNTGRIVTMSNPYFYSAFFSGKHFYS